MKDLMMNARKGVGRGQLSGKPCWKCSGRPGCSIRSVARDHSTKLGIGASHRNKYAARAIVDETRTSLEELVCPVEQRGLQKSLERTETFSLSESQKINLADLTPEALEDAYERCGLVTEYYAKTFYLGTQLMTPEKARAIWAIYVWCNWMKGALLIAAYFMISVGVWFV